LIDWKPLEAAVMALTSTSAARMQRNARLLFGALLAVGGLCFGTVGAAQAAQTISVNTADDDPSATCVSAGPCSLRGAVAAANAQPGSTILMSPGRTFILTHGELHITADGTRINGQAPGTPIILVDSGRALLIEAGNVALNNVELRGQSGLVHSPVLGDSLLSFIAAAGQTLSLEGVPISGGNAHEGGAIYQSGGILGISGSLLSDNNADTGGAISVHDGLTLIDGNTLATNTAGVSLLGNGAAIAASNSTVVALNSTIYGNTAWGNGGALWLTSGSHLSLISATIDRNRSVAQVAARDRSTIAATNTVIGDSSESPACDLPAGNPIIDDHVVTADSSCGLHAANGSIQNISPLFLAYGDYGAILPILPYQRESVLVDGGNSDPAVCPLIDEVYVPRPYGGGCDIGALESPFSNAPAPPANIGGATATGGSSSSGSGPKQADSTAADSPAPAVPPTPAPAAAVSPSPTPVVPSPPSAAHTPTVRLSRDGRMTILAALPVTPSGPVTLTWSVRKGGRIHRGTVVVRSPNRAIATTVLTPKRLRGARLISVVATYNTHSGKPRRTIL
jgi:CSLREA domain-containing protein